MAIDLASFWGKNVRVKTDDDQVFEGLVQAYESVEDSDTGIDSIDIVHTKQFPHNILGLDRNEIVNIEEVDA
ncbi:hypothetical protein BSQ39_08235 [Loigolactobacillus backii]|uniref:hypothetical protein n=1 Tax=Loigolactobacillus backii TaxID=375175 RepID=UPI000C1CAE6D|nr:hypothetical protein [Loigolactobacillus backii]PIO83552.1 hypothetical protein BSQ39_08235 [Loigolactobacillus backii]